MVEGVGIIVSMGEDEIGWEGMRTLGGCATGVCKAMRAHTSEKRRSSAGSYAYLICDTVFPCHLVF